MSNKTLKIYIWETQGENVGHGSMTLSDGTHISLWPKSQKRFNDFYDYLPVQAQTPESYDVDKGLEGEDATHTIPIKSNKIEEDKIKAWWTSFKDHGMYHILFRNCCSAVYLALKEGGADKIVAFPEDTISTPQNLESYARKLENACK